MSRIKPFVIHPKPTPPFKPIAPPFQEAVSPKATASSPTKNIEDYFHFQEAPSAKDAPLQMIQLCDEFGTVMHVAETSLISQETFTHIVCAMHDTATKNKWLPLHRTCVYTFINRDKSVYNAGFIRSESSATCVESKDPPSMLFNRGPYGCGNQYAAALLQRARDRRVKILLFNRDGSKFLENTYQGTLCATVADRLAAALKGTQ